jgi:outer membrane protein OmpA-like peptidoglycan-associated protein
MLFERTRHRRRLSLLALASSAGIASCGASTPRELIQARSEYRRATVGAAPKLAPEQLEVARKSLVSAEQAYASDPKADETADLAYVAERTAQIAEVTAGISLDDADRKYTEAELEDTRRRLEVARQESDALAQQQKRAERARELAREEELRLDRERDNQERIARERQAEMLRELLERVATVRDDSRGLTIVMSTGALFDDKGKLAKQGESRLDPVVDTIRQRPSTHVSIESYTDTRGDDAQNRRISQIRADAVREYFVRHGIPDERVEAKGLGPDNPVDDNATPAGRANNRRIEIVLESSNA